MTYCSIYLEKLMQVITVLKDVWWPCLQPGSSTLLCLYSFLLVEF